MYHIVCDLAKLSGLIEFFFFVSEAIHMAGPTDEGKADLFETEEEEELESGDTGSEEEVSYQAM